MPQESVGTTLGVFLCSAFIDCCLLGLNLLAVAQYFYKYGKHDRGIFQGMVLSLIINSGTHPGPMISYRADVVAILANAITVFIAQCFFIYQIWRILKITLSVATLGVRIGMQGSKSSD
ncbi:hypothetical protein K435DRAFT_802602 [Dendrothele bispora CBS 962.96]|uniref:Uncharacterized protein n=1 Tax=Dendrothele bispora (strain CBS 962.96) TaxID=1314807 RepID=A0A4S8LKC7_DENBC|nr:hypothetical protein K435DRAFT_802602 [Dendrothele bispora CBS 962.96]